VDIILNHMTGDHANAVGVGGSTADTYNLQYPAVPFGPNDFNQPQCGIDNYADPDNVSDEGADCTRSSHTSLRCATLCSPTF